MEEVIHLGMWNPSAVSMEDFLLANIPQDGKWREVRFEVKLDPPQPSNTQGGV